MPSSCYHITLASLAVGVLALIVFFSMPLLLAEPWSHNETLAELVELWFATTWGWPLLISVAFAFSVVIVTLLFG